MNTYLLYNPQLANQRFLAVDDIDAALRNAVEAASLEIKDLRSLGVVDHAADAVDHVFLNLAVTCT